MGVECGGSVSSAGLEVIVPGVRLEGVVVGVKG